MFVYIVHCHPYFILQLFQLFFFLFFFLLTSLCLLFTVVCQEEGPKTCRVGTDNTKLLCLQILDHVKEFVRLSNLVIIKKIRV